MGEGGRGVLLLVCVCNDTWCALAEEGGVGRGDECAPKLATLLKHLALCASGSCLCACSLIDTVLLLCVVAVGVCCVWCMCICRRVPTLSMVGPRRVLVTCWVRLSLHSRCQTWGDNMMMTQVRQSV